MQRQVYVFLLQVLAICFANSKIPKPEQVHLAFGDTVDTIVVTWNTIIRKGEPDHDDQPSTVQYGINTLDKTATGEKVAFKYGPYIRFIHKVTIPNLERSAEYMYKCGNDKTGWTKIFQFRIPPPDDVWQPKVSIYGDMGLTNNHALPRIIKETIAKKFDVIFHIGDFGYDMNDYGATTGDRFMNMIEPIAANMPYMTCVGNHESDSNFSQYNYRFNMPGEKDMSIHIYSINMGPVHFISLSTEVYAEGSDVEILTQRNFLRKDLIKANLPENRAKQPWIIVMGHRPLYCSNPDSDQDVCNKLSCPFRNDLEKMFYTYGVDMIIGAHEHSYERMWPVYNYTVHNGTESPYQDPDAPITFVTGSAGCKEGADHFVDNPLDYSAFRSSDYGTTAMYVYNQTHIHIQQISDDKGGIVIDDFWVIKHSHKFYPGSDMTLSKLREHCNKEFDYFERKELCNDDMFSS